MIRIPCFKEGLVRNSWNMRKKCSRIPRLKQKQVRGEANVKDKIVTLSTCTGNQATRFVVQGKRVNAVDPQ